MSEDLAWLAGASLLAAAALGVPIRLFGWEVVWGGVVRIWRFTRGHRWKILLILLVGAAFGLWGLETVQEIFFGLWR